MTMTLVSTVTVGSGGASTIEFASIPATGTDLYVTFSTRSTAAGVGTYDNVGVRLNSDTGSNYTTRVLLGEGSGTPVSYSYSSTQIFTWSVAADATSNTFGNGGIYIPNYAGSSAKTVSIDAVGETNGTNTSQVITAGRWSGTAAITSLLIRPQNGNFAQYSTASLYTITKGSGGATVS